MSKLLAGLGLLGGALMGAKVRRGVDPESGRVIFYKFVDEKDLMKVYDRLEKEDRQSAELLLDVVQKLQDKLDIGVDETAAMSRVIGISRKGRTWDTAMLRNNIFKAANLLGMELPSHMF